MRWVNKKNVRLMPGIFCFLLFAGGSLFSQSPVLFKSGIQTRLTREEGYISSGAVLLNIPPETIIKTMSELSIIDKWLMEGMGEEAARENKLIVALNFLERSPGREYSCAVNFSLLLTKHWLIRDQNMDVSIEVSPEQTGWINLITYKLPLKSLFIKDGGYKVFIIPMGMGRSLVVFDFKIHLAGIPELFFKEENYKRNIEWYINRILNNCIIFLEK